MFPPPFRRFVPPAAGFPLLLVLLLVLTGCTTRVRLPQTTPSLDRPEWGLVRCSEPPSRQEYRTMLRSNGDTLGRALRRSRRYYSRAASRNRFPVGPVTHGRARRSLDVLEDLIRSEKSLEKRVDVLRRTFECYRPRGVDPGNGVMFTGYFAPVYPARRRPTAGCRHPLYRKPRDLRVDSATGRVLGEPVLGGWLGYRPYPTRRQLETSDRLVGKELVYLCSRMDQYLVHVQGSARLVFPDGSSLHVGYAASNGRTYVSVGKKIREHANPPRKLTVPGIRRFFRNNPESMDRFLRMNPRFIFFRQTHPERWPAGSTGVKLTPLHSLATAKQWFPPAAPVLVTAPLSDGNGGFRTQTHLMFNQDTGGAFHTRRRADVFFGTDRSAGRRAGRQSGRGSMRFLFLKPGTTNARERPDVRSRPSPGEAAAKPIDRPG